MLYQSSRGGGQARPDQTHYPPLQRVMIFIRRTRLSISHHPSTTITHQLSSILEQINLPPAESKPEPIDDHPPPRDLIVPLDPIWSMTVPPTNRVPRLACTYFGTWLGRWCIVYFLRINLDPFQIIGSDYIIPKSVRCLRSGFMSLSRMGSEDQPKVMSRCRLFCGVFRVSRDFRKILWRCCSFPSFSAHIPATT